MLLLSHSPVSVLGSNLFLPSQVSSLRGHRTITDWVLPIIATKADVENHFNSHGTGEITEIKLMNGFGFLEYKDAMDAQDVVPGRLYCHGPFQQRLIHVIAFRM